MKNGFAHAITKPALTDRIKTLLSSFEVKRDLKLICIWEFVFCFGDGLFYFLLPVYISQINASPAEIGMLYSSHYLSWAVTLLMGGFLADKFDQKKLMIIGSLLWIPVPLALAIANNWTQLWLPMILYGTYFGSSSACVYVLRSASSGKTMQAFGLWSASVAFGYLFSPLVGGFLSSTFGKQMVFYIAAGFYSASILPLIFISRLPKAEPLETRAAPKYSFAEFIRSKKLIVLCVFFAMIIFAVFFISPLISQFMHGVYNQSIFNLGVIGTATSSGWIFFSFALGKIGDKRSKMTAVLASTAICSFSFSVIALINNFPILCLASFLTGASHCIIGFVPAIIGSVAPERYVGRWISVGQTSIMVASAVAPAFGGAMYEVSPFLAFSVTISLLLSLTALGLLKKL